MTQATACLQDDQIDSLLQGHLTPREGTLAEEHLEACEQCRARVEETIGSGPWWTELRNVLGDSSVDRPSAREHSGGEDGPNRTTAKLLDLLGPTDDPNMLGRIGPYEIVGLLGSGGMGAVFKGFDRSLHRFVAIKLMLPHLASSAAARRRFAREGQAVAAVVNDHVMPIHCVDEWRGVPYLVMTYARGVSLQKRLSDSGPLELQEILRIGLQTAKGLAAAHAQGIVHRDVKPANIFLDQTVERVQLMDFGLARAVDDASLTRTGALAGTPQYMSPEQARGEAVDHRSDLFSLGSVLYAMCTGRAPFRAESSYGILRLITDNEPRSIRELNRELPAWLSAIISRLMAKRPDDRYSSAAEVATLLEQCLAHVQQPTTAPLPDAVRPATANRHGLPPVGARLVAAACAFLFVLAGVLLVLELNKGTLTIESDVEDIPIRITQSDQTVDTLTVSKSGKSLRVAAGEYRIEIDGAVEGLRVEGERVNLIRGGRSVVKIVKRNSVDAKPAEVQTNDNKPNHEQPLSRENAGTPDSSPTDSLARAVERCNQLLRLKHPQDHSLYAPPLTKDEVIASVAWRLRGDVLTPSERELRAAIVERRQMPEQWDLISDLDGVRAEDEIVIVFRIFLQKGDSERFTVRERRHYETSPQPRRKSPRNEAQGDRSLVAAIKRFNARHHQIDGQKQPALSESEVLAAIIHEISHREEHDESDELSQRFRAIFWTGLLPQGAEIEVIPTFETEGGDVYTIWSIRLKLLKEEAEKQGGTYAFIIREQFISVKHQDAGEIELAINEQVAATADSDETIRATIADKQLEVVFESSDAVDVNRTIKVLGKQGGVEIQPGSSTWIELPQPTKELSWHAGDAPEVIGDSGLAEPFTHVWCRWQKDGRIRWTCYGSAKNKATGGR